MLQQIRIRTRILLILLGIVVLFLVMAFYITSTANTIRDLGTEATSEVMMEGQKAKVKVSSHAMAIALSEAVKKSGLKNTEKINELLRAMVKSARYENDRSGYFFIYKGHVNIAFPVKEEAQGKDLGNLKDKNGVYVIRELDKKARSGGGYVSYIWPKPGAGDTPKISYAEMIPGLDMWVGTGIYIDNIEQTKNQLHQEMTRIAAKKTMHMELIAGAIFLSIVVFCFIVAWGISSGLKNLITSFRDVAEGEGDLTKRISVDSRDELGELGTLFNTFLGKLQKMIQKIAEEAAEVNTSAHSLTDLSTSINSSSNETASIASNVAHGTGEMSDNLKMVALTMDDSSSNTAMVAEVAQEMTGTITNIASNAEKANAITEEAVEQATKASKRMGELGEAADAIGKVTETITDISEQTNLLALNATIEAARAGESGKGFAVVANEIKELAKQTAEATQHIKNQISDMQSTTEMTVGEIEGISSIIHQVSELVSTITFAVEEQSAATGEIANSIDSVSKGLGDINESVNHSSNVAENIAQDIQKVSGAAEEITVSSDQMRQQAEQLQNLATELTTIVSRFKI
ncbi:methyl-accepting chemotaxis protein [Desulfobulbus rhabdoformis]|uniref:methyl-accepting chemotaxis protein n=1 Tax=Desulfobulbus rhabdoformis TaxID=34032 RepID=UPI0019632020|nr:methyl-accepting chemotaxis protein [Desulfobulbus rhabdoformis]MBM9613799.1 methyl-accepting chemotaxis protein [Desulfobulbus rhabdoformis]